MGTKAEQVDTKGRLSDRDRAILTGISVLALAAAGSALFSAFGAQLAFFGEQPSVREDAVAAQSMWAVLWALATPFCCWAVLRGEWLRVTAVTVWLMLLALCRLWSWPPPPVDGFDSQVKPLWGASSAGVLPWLLLVASLVVGTYAAWRDHDRRNRVWAVILIIGVIAIAGLSVGNLIRQARDEEPTPLAEGPEELAVLEQDPLWSVLPTASITETEEHLAELTAWEERNPSWKRVTLGTTPDQAVFEQVVGLAESSDWTLHGSFCYGTTADATFSKTLPGGPIHLNVTSASYTDGVDVFMSHALAPGEPEAERCWEST